MPAWFTKWETTGLLTFEDKRRWENSILHDNSRTQHFSHKRPKETKAAELTIDKDIMVANPEIANLPNWVIVLAARSFSCSTIYCRFIISDFSFCIS
jgi:cation/acetate symporter